MRYICGVGTHGVLVITGMLEFKAFEIESIKKISSLIREQSYRTCDYSIGGIYMWIKYFDYRYCIHEDMLYIKCLSDRKESFMLPVGQGSLADAVSNLRAYCSLRSIPFRLIGVPQDALASLPGNFVSEHTRKWDDYLYDASALVAYEGHALKNKRNRMKHFIHTYDYAFEALGPENMSEAKRFVKIFMEQNMEEENFFRDYENEETLKVLDRWDKLPFNGFFIRAEGEIAGIIIGERVNDTLFIHIEKANRAYSGINEVLTARYVEETTRLHPQIGFVNREEDMGDEGLRRSKLSFNPQKIIEKYTVAYE